LVAVIEDWPHASVGKKIVVVGLLLFVASVFGVVFIGPFTRDRTSANNALEDYLREPLPTPESPAPKSSKSIISALSHTDPDFSLTLLEDFAYRLYAAAQCARHDPRALAALAPYFSEDVRRELMIDPQRDPHISYVVVGALRATDLCDSPAGFDLTLDFTANLGREQAGADRGALHVEERWVLRRAHGARTRPPEEVLRLGCPNCAAPFMSSDHRRCDHCGEIVSDGRFTWHVVSRTVREARDVLTSLLATVQEAGTDAPSRVDPGNESVFRSLQRDDPRCSDAALRAHARKVFDGINQAWNEHGLEAMRPLATEAMLDYLRYWLGAYDRLGLRNFARDAKVSRISRVKVVRDRHFDAVTFRIWASCFDFTVDVASQETVAGSATETRRYSEYWTFVRSAKARSKASVACPGCSAPLPIQRAGVCPHCGAAVQRGEHDWVLSKIEQDDVYT
jgi:hypothetical protein